MNETYDLKDIIISLSNLLQVKECHCAHCCNENASSCNCKCYPVGEEVRKAFANLLAQKVIMVLGAGCELVIAYDTTEIEYNGKWKDKMTIHLADVIEQLPNLQEGNHYCLPADTFLCTFNTKVDKFGIAQTKLKYSLNIIQGIT